ncbi:proton-conducting transporter membrane subunit [Shigella flexneri]
MTPEVLHLVGLSGRYAAAGRFAALVQTDIKRVLAYSTMSQLATSSSRLACRRRMRRFST